MFTVDESNVMWECAECGLSIEVMELHLKVIVSEWKNRVELTYLPFSLWPLWDDQHEEHGLLVPISTVRKVLFLQNNYV